jgi:hypothetical protein
VAPDVWKAHVEKHFPAKSTEEAVRDFEEAFAKKRVDSSKF